jgi:hypothetical protein
MARVSRRKTVVARMGGLYQLVVQAVEENFAEWDAHPKPRHYLTGELLPNPYQYQRALDAVRGGAPVNVAVCDLPVDVRQSIPLIRRDVRGVRRPSRALVSPDDLMIVTGDDVLPWMEENGLLNDFGPPAKRLCLVGNI